MTEPNECPCGTEKHHIKPLALGGSDVPGNIACLTPEEHDRVHREGPVCGATPSGKTVCYDPRIKPSFESDDRK